MNQTLIKLYFFLTQRSFYLKLKKNKLFVFIKSYVWKLVSKTRKDKLQKYGYEFLEIFFNICEEVGVDAWIDWGTLLGFVRSGELIRYDDDLDIGIVALSDEKHTLLINSLYKHNLKKVREFKRNSILILESFSYKGILLDVCYYIPNGQDLFCYMFKLGERTEIKYVKGIEHSIGYYSYKYIVKNEQTEKVFFNNGCKCYVPQNAENRVAKLYGDNWKIPCTDFNWEELNNYIDEGYVENFTGWRKE
ncbi:MAG: LicD family protein [Spirochaetaceae bacterium]|nr:LicD family protein [Spirochaetaceae bacterium]